MVVMCILLLSGLQAVSAQSKKPGNWHIEQSESESDSITIHGLFKTKGVIGWRNVPENVYISITSNGKFVTGDLQLFAKGEFNIKASRKKMEGTTISVTISAQDYGTIEIKNIQPKNTFLEVYTEKTALRVNGQ